MICIYQRRRPHSQKRAIKAVLLHDSVIFPSNTYQQKSNEKPKILQEIVV